MADEHECPYGAQRIIHMRVLYKDQTKDTQPATVTPDGNWNDPVTVRCGEHGWLCERCQMDVVKAAARAIIKAVCWKGQYSNEGV